MQEFQEILNKVLLGAEGLAALMGALYFLRLYKSYWKWFSLYLILIFIQEWFWIGNNTSYAITPLQYYAIVGVPLQYLFLYWLYAKKSLQHPVLFYTCVGVYVFVILLFLISFDIQQVYTLSTTIGTIILTVLVVLEFIKQIKNDDILKFRENKMFYVNTGIILFYLGTYPFHVFNDELYERLPQIYSGYYTYFLLANITMYLLFSASFIWGKPQS